MKNRTRVSHAALLLFAIAAHAHSAPDEGSVTGAVTDAAGKPVRNATVSVQNASVPQSMRQRRMQTAVSQSAM
ncbi:hypothetical protein ADM96_23300 [Burkholderia sp. ST111]|nr:hypothetical protein ADM96_23300 [Burkholderia sp. ST111]